MIIVLVLRNIYRSHFPKVNSMSTKKLLSYFSAFTVTGRSLSSTETLLTYWCLCEAKTSRFLGFIWAKNGFLAATHPTEPFLPTVQGLALVPDAEQVFAWLYFEPLRKWWPSSIVHHIQTEFWLHCNTYCLRLLSLEISNLQPKKSGRCARSQ